MIIYDSENLEGGTGGWFWPLEFEMLVLQGEMSCGCLCVKVELTGESGLGTNTWGFSGQPS